MQNPTKRVLNMSGKSSNLNITNADTALYNWVVIIGLWGTSNPKRVAVTQVADDPEQVVGYIWEVRHRDGWSAENDPEENLFSTPREAAEIRVNKRVEN